MTLCLCKMAPFKGLCVFVCKEEILRNNFLVLNTYMKKSKDWGEYASLYRFATYSQWQRQDYICNDVTNKFMQFFLDS